MLGYGLEGMIWKTEEPSVWVLGHDSEALHSMFLPKPRLNKWSHNDNWVFAKLVSKIQPVTDYVTCLSEL